MYPKTHLHLNSKQSGQLIAVIVGLSIAQIVVNKVKAHNEPKTHKFDNIWIKEDPKTGLVTCLTVYKGGEAKQYTWTHKK
jgi:hypothetical protein